MKKVIYIMLCAYFSVQAQDPQIEWQKTIGGDLLDRGEISVIGLDGSILIASYSSSGVSGDKTEPSLGGGDVWLVNLDTNGNIVWQKAIGGDGDDYVTSIVTTNDGGYALSIQSDSNASIFKSEDSKGGRDFWIVKLDANGNILWENTIGGALDDNRPTLTQLEDGGYMVAGLSQSGVSGDKTEGNIGSQDFWVLKLDASGSIVWQDTVGGTDYDSPHSIVELEDGSILVGGVSSSNISGDKTENSKGGNDFWLIKFDSVGNILWDKTIGGDGLDSLNFILATNANELILLGNSESGISGDKTELSRGEADVWIVKINDSGAIIDQATIGGSALDMTAHGALAANGNILISAVSRSPISGEKNEESQGNADYWLLGVSPSLDLIYQNTIGGSNGDNAGNISLTSNGKVILSGTSNSDISGDKTENSKGQNDIWILQINPGILNVNEFTQSDFEIYPIPATTTIHIESKNHMADSIEIFDAAGRSVKIFDINAIHATFNISELNTGIYFLTIQSGSQKHVKKIIKR